MSCRDLARLYPEYAEGALPLLARLRLRLHLARCRDCRRYREQMAAVSAALRLLPPPPVPPAVRADLLRRFDRWRRSR
jgi:anti-sigma factor RsiW